MKKWKKYAALFLAVSMMMNAMPFSVKAAEAKAVDKTAEWNDISKQIADVTLSVPGESEELGSDIIYIMGSFAMNDDGSPNVQGDAFISSLVSTMEEMVEKGTTVNFGIVPFSSDSVVAMPLTNINESNIAELPDMIAAALKTCKSLYDGVNMENALLKAQKMFSESDLHEHPERQHLVMVTSGRTYFFNSGENNEHLSVVPVNFVSGTTNSNGLFYTNKLWQRARNGHTNNYEIPSFIKTEHAKAVENGSTLSLWDFYWSYIDQWVRADIAAGDSVVYEAMTVEEGHPDNKNFLTWFNSGSAYGDNDTFRSKGFGTYIPMSDPTELAKYVSFAAGANPFTNAAAAHAIGYERAQWEAYQLWQTLENTGINCYPICYESPAYLGGVGDSFVDMLAGGKAVKYTSTSDKTFFDPIKNEILYACAAGSYVEDVIGYDNNYNFDFLVDGEISLTVGKVEYTMTKLATAKDGFDASYTFTAPAAEAPTFWVDYVKGNGTDGEKFIWTFGENVSYYAPVSLNYQVVLAEVVNDPAEKENMIVATNKSAILYPVDTEGNEGAPIVFPVPELELKKYTVTYLNDETVLQFTEAHMTGDAIPECQSPADYENAEDGLTYTFTGWELVEGTEGANDTIGNTNLVYEAMFAPIPEYTVTYLNGEEVLQATDELLTGAEIPGCTAPEDYKIGNVTYKFIGWELIEGTEGEGKKVGTTNLVYKAVFEEIPEFTVTYVNGETVLQKTEELLTGADIPTCAAPEDYTEGNMIYKFIGWELVEGTEGEGKKVGTTNLVYKAMFEETEMEEIEEDEIPLGPEPPKTGDPFSIALWAGAIVMSGATALISGKKREEEE